MTSYNPGSPDRVGLEWPATRQRWDALGTTVTPGALFVARSTTAFTQVRAFLRFDGGPTPSGFAVCDLYLINPTTPPTFLKSFGTTSVSSTTGAWTTFTITSGTQAFLVGSVYLIVIRKSNAQYALSWATLDCSATVGAETVQTPDHFAVQVPLSVTTLQPSAPIRAQQDPGARSIGFVTSLGVYLIDSQVYALAVPQHVDALHEAVVQAMPVSSSPTGQVSITLLNDANAHHADAMAISFPDDPTIPAVPFPIELLPTIPDGRWYRVHVELPTPLPAGSAHRIQLTSPTSDDRNWTVAGLSTGAPADTTLSVRTFQGTGTMSDIGYDTVMTNDAQLAAPTSLTFSLAQIDTSRGLSQCVLPFVYMPQLNWPVTSAIETKLDHYEIQRNDDGTWRTIAIVGRGTSVTSPPGGPTHFIDYEALRNTPIRYRIRMVTTAGVLSAWREAGPITMPSEENDILLFSNWRQDIYWAGFSEGAYTWDQVDASRVATKMLYARNRQYAVREDVFRGDRFDRTLLLAVADPAMPRLPDQTLAGLPHYAPPGRVVFDPLLDIAHARDVPYVTLLDARSRRWYTAPAVTALHEDEPWKQYRADASFIEVTDVPAPVTALTLPVLPVTGIGWDNDNWANAAAPAAGDGVWG